MSRSTCCNDSAIRSTRAASNVPLTCSTSRTRPERSPSWPAAASPHPVVVGHPVRFAPDPPNHAQGPEGSGRAGRRGALDVWRNRGGDEDAQEDQNAPHHRRLENSLRDRRTIRPEDRPPSLLRRVVAHDDKIRQEGKGQVPWTKEVHWTPPLAASREFVLKELSITLFIACHPRWVPSALRVLREEPANREPGLLGRRSGPGAEPLLEQRERNPDSLPQVELAP